MVKLTDLTAVSLRFLLLVLVLANFSTGRQNVPRPRLRNLQTAIGVGYDIFRGNPNPTPPNLVDPGFRVPIFELDTESNDSDVGFDVKLCSACSLTFTTHEMRSLASYVEWLRGSAVTVMCANADASFSGSEDYKEVEKLLRVKNLVVETTASCTAYCAKIHYYRPPPFTADFRQAVENLPKEYTNETREQFDDFFGNFGTHVVMSANFGSRFLMRASICRNRLEHLDEMGANLPSMANHAALFEVITCTPNNNETLAENGFYCNDTDYEHARLFKRYASNLAINYFGAKPPSSGFDNDWLDASSNTDEAQAISVSLVATYKLLTHKRFPNDTGIGDKHVALEKALANYCADTLLPDDVVEQCSAASSCDLFGFYNHRTKPRPPKYFVIPTNKGFRHVDAEESCVLQGAKLAVIKDVNDNSIASRIFIGAHPYCAWMGLTGGPGAWQWLDGTPAERSYLVNGWMPWEGRTGDPELCAAMCHDGGLVGWADLNCDHPWLDEGHGPVAALCERIVKTLVEEEVPAC